ncbi:hypothetical protein BDA96_03G277300 [Sorghum bicolor]|uniref:Uncharacterized protein n=2 Tax=Sorghum bicolor TaxID=4558 RepID=A0A1B6Q5F2_SORBI|nr:hypothetical protein BDA96_03G277300 [Sorghum bicolor]KXG33115.1 hypothetical protein SORBI_3003G256600 [Sorghum bicolor]
MSQTRNGVLIVAETFQDVDSMSMKNSASSMLSGKKPAQAVVSLVGCIFDEFSLIAFSAIIGTGTGDHLNTWCFQS